MDNPVYTINPIGSPILMKPTKDGRERCRFDLFVRLYPGTRTYFPKNESVWTMRGDKYLKIEELMLGKLVRHLILKRKSYIVIELYDNTYCENDEKRVILKSFEGSLMKSNLLLYKEQGFLNNSTVPDYMILKS